jgi:putative ABC transport system permease protein
MNRLSWWLILAQFRTRRAATLLSMLAIALGVALGYAIHLINDAALADFARAMQTVQGNPDARACRPRQRRQRPAREHQRNRSRPRGAADRSGHRNAAYASTPPTPVRLIGIDVFSAAALMPRLLPRHERSRRLGAHSRRRRLCLTGAARPIRAASGQRRDAAAR